MTPPRAVTDRINAAQDARLGMADKAPAAVEGVEGQQGEREWKLARPARLVRRARLAILPGHDDKSRLAAQSKAVWRREKRRIESKSTRAPA